MNVIKSVKTTSKLIYNFGKAHKSTICIGFGLAATAKAFYEGCKATAKSVRQIDEENTFREASALSPMTAKEKIELCGKNYISAGAWLTVGFASIGYGHHLGIKQTAIATAFAEESEKAYVALRDSVNDILEGEEGKETKDKIIKEFDKKVYGDGGQPIDKYYPMKNDICTGRSESVVAIPKYERFKDEFGFECWSTREVIGTVKDLFKMEVLNDAREGTLADFYDCISSHGGHIIRQPEYGYRKGYRQDQIKEFDFRPDPDYDASGLFYSIVYDVEAVDLV